MQNNLTDLVGIWSVDVMYGPGAQEDTILVFLANGKGWTAFYHYILLERETFHWYIDDGGLLHITGDTYAGHQTEVRPSDWNICGLTYHITNEIVPSGEKMEVLTFTQPFWCHESRFGLLGKDVSEECLPQMTRKR